MTQLRIEYETDLKRMFIEVRLLVPTFDGQQVADSRVYSFADYDVSAAECATMASDFIAGAEAAVIAMQGRCYKNQGTMGMRMFAKKADQAKAEGRIGYKPVRLNVKGNATVMAALDRHKLDMPYGRLIAAIEDSVEFNNLRYQSQDQLTHPIVVDGEVVEDVIIHAALDVAFEPMEPVAETVEA